MWQFARFNRLKDNEPIPALLNLSISYRNRYYRSKREIAQHLRTRPRRIWYALGKSVQLFLVFFIGSAALGRLVSGLLGYEATSGKLYAGLAICSVVFLGMVYLSLPYLFFVIRLAKERPEPKS